MIEFSQMHDGSFRRGFGGDTLNAALYLARLGIDTSYVTALGDDALSEEMLAAWRSENIKTDLVIRAGGRLPGLYIIQRDAQGAYVLVADPAGKAQRKDIDATRLDGSDWIVSSGVSPGDRVIVSGLQRVMQPGQAVTAKPVEPAQPDAAKAAPASATKQG